MDLRKNTRPPARYRDEQTPPLLVPAATKKKEKKNHPRSSTNKEMRGAGDDDEQPSAPEVIPGSLAESATSRELATEQNWQPQGSSAAHEASDDEVRHISFDRTIASGEPALWYDRARDFSALYGLPEEPGTFGLNHEPAFESSGSPFADSDEENGNSKEIWFPSVYQNQANWSDLRTSPKFITMYELSTVMTFKSIVNFLQLSDSEIVAFIKLWQRYAGRQNAEEKRIKATNRRTLTMATRREDQAEIDKIWKKEVDNHPDRTTPLKITHGDLLKIERFLRNFRVQEELDLIQITTPTGLSTAEPLDVPPYLQMETIITNIKENLGVDTKWNYKYDFGIRTYVAAEINDWGGIDDGVSSDHEADEAAAPVAGPKQGRGRTVGKNSIRRLARRPTKEDIDAVSTGEGSTTRVRDQALVVSMKVTPSRLREATSVESEE